MAAPTLVRRSRERDTRRSRKCESRAVRQFRGVAFAIPQNGRVGDGSKHQENRPDVVVTDRTRFRESPRARTGTHVRPATHLMETLDERWRHGQRRPPRRRAHGRVPAAAGGQNRERSGSSVEQIREPWAPWCPGSPRIRGDPAADIRLGDRRAARQMRPMTSARATGFHLPTTPGSSRDPLPGDRPHASHMR